MHDGKRLVSFDQSEASALDVDVRTVLNQSDSSRTPLADTSGTFIA